MSAEKSESSDEVEAGPKEVSGQGYLGVMPYVVPMALFMLWTALIEPAVGKQNYVWAYIGKVILVTGSLIVYRRAWRDFRFTPMAVMAGLFVGLLVFAEWIVVDRYTPPLKFLGGRVGFDPATITNSSMRSLFLGFRFFGLAVMVPMMEELFWRSFLLRYITDPEFEKVPLGTFSWGAFAAVAVAFALAHPEWLAALVCAIVYGLLLRYTRNLSACLIAHSLTNLLLGLYVLNTHQWKFW